MRHTLTFLAALFGTLALVASPARVQASEPQPEFSHLMFGVKAALHSADIDGVDKYDSSGKRIASPVAQGGVGFVAQLRVLS